MDTGDDKMGVLKAEDVELGALVCMVRIVSKITREKICIQVVVTNKFAD